MPSVKVKMFPGRTLDQKREMAEVLTREVARIAICPENDVDVIFEEISKDSWALGGTLHSERKV